MANVDPFAKVSVGDPFRFKAMVHNALIDLINERRIPGLGGGKSLPGSPENETAILVRNKTGADLPQFGIVAISTPSILQTDNDPAFRSRRFWEGDTPSTTATIAITQEPIAKGNTGSETTGRIGPAIIVGETPAKVNVSDATHTYCVPSTSTATLDSAVTGPIKLLWYDASGGATGDNKWARVLLLGDAPSNGLTVIVDDCCDTEMVHGGGLSFGGGLVFGGAHCGCKPSCGCGGGSGGGGGGGSNCPECLTGGGLAWLDLAANVWRLYPPTAQFPYPHLTWCGGGTGNQPMPPSGPVGSNVIQVGQCQWTWPNWSPIPGPGGGVGAPIPGGGMGGSPSQPGQNVGGPTKPWGGCPPGFKPRPDGLPGCCNGSWYWSGNQWLCDDSGNAPIPRFSPTQSLANAISFGSGVTLSGPPAPFLFANQGGLGIDASTAASGEVPIADGAGSFTMGTPASSPANAQWLKLTKTYTDFSTAAFSNTITLRTFAAKEVLFSCIVKHSTSFSGGGITSYVIDVSDVTGVLLPGHITTFDAKQAVGNTAFQIGSRATGSTDTAFTDVSFAGANMLIKASCDGGHTLNQATQGSIDIWLLIGTMP